MKDIDFGMIILNILNFLISFDLLAGYYIGTVQFLLAEFQNIVPAIICNSRLVIIFPVTYKYSKISKIRQKNM